jgi:hypothetical protein
MAATSEQIDRLRRMVAETSPSSAYTGAILAGYIERYPLLDELGNEPTVAGPTTPVTMIANDDWMATYDLNAAAADVWAEKAAALATEFDFSSAGANYQRSQAYQAAMQQSRYYRSRRAASTIRQWPSPKAETETE